MVQWRKRISYVKDIEDVVEPCFRKNAVSLFDKEPGVAAEWCYKKNCGFGPEDFSHASMTKAWWTCPDCKRVYKALICKRTSKRKDGCTYCASKLVCSDNSLVVLCPEIAAQWHPTKNKKDKPSNYTFASKKEVWWKCPRGDDHEWKSVIKIRTDSTSGIMGCPFCAGLRASKGNNIHDNYPEIAKQWHPTKNGKLTPRDFTCKSNKNVWWQCAEGHTWKTEVYNRTSGKGCPFCAGQMVAVNKSLQAVRPEIAREWHPSKNGIHKPKHYMPKSNVKVWWQCKAGHEWEAMIHTRTKGHGCPYCTNQKANKENCLLTQYPRIAEEWHPTRNGELTAADVLPGTKRKVWWLCSVDPTHEWEQSPEHRLRTGVCIHCNRRKVPYENSLEVRAPEFAKEFHPTLNGHFTAKDTSSGSDKLIWWQCSRDASHVWEMRPRTRVSSTAKTTCPDCRWPEAQSSTPIS